MPGGITWHIIGQPKTRKTTEASKWSAKGQEGVLLIDTDLGSDFIKGANVATVTSLDIPMRPVLKNGKPVLISSPDHTESTMQLEPIPPLERGFVYRSGPEKGQAMPVYSMQETMMWLAQSWDKLPYDTIVIDTIDRINEWIEDIVINDLKITAMGEAEWGADYGRARKRGCDKVKKLQSFVKQRGATLVLISHAKTSQIVDGNVQLAPELPRGLGKALAAVADVIGYVTFDKNGPDPMISFLAYDERIIGSRLRPLSQQRIPFSYLTIMETIQQYKEGK